MTQMHVKARNIPIEGGKWCDCHILKIYICMLPTCNNKCQHVILYPLFLAKINVLHPPSVDHINCKNKPTWMLQSRCCYENVQHQSCHVRPVFGGICWHDSFVQQSCQLCLQWASCFFSLFMSLYCPVSTSVSAERVYTGTTEIWNKTTSRRL